MSTTTTPNMGMVLPVPSSEPGPAWAVELIAALTNKLDAHKHGPGDGVQIGADGLNLQDDLELNNHNLVELGQLVFNGGVAATKLTLYTDGTDLFFKDVNGVAVKLTASGAVNVGAARGINGDYSTDVANPSAYYTTSTKEYSLTTDGSTKASLRIGQLRVGTRSVNGDYTITTTDGEVVLLVNTGAARAITLPAAASSTGRLLTIKDSTGTANAHTITVSRAGGDTIDGATSKTITTSYGVLRLISDGTNWFVL